MLPVMPRSPAHEARDAALIRLMAENTEDWARLLNEERVKRGLNPIKPRRRTAKETA